MHWLESVQGLPSQDQLKAFASGYLSYDAFVCGPAPFMKATVTALKELEFPRERRHQEKFVSLGGNPFGDLHDREVAEHEIEDAESDADDAAVDAHRPAAGAGPARGRARRRELRLRRLGARDQAARPPRVEGREGAVLLP